MLQRVIPIAKALMQCARALVAVFDNHEVSYEIVEVIKLITNKRTRHNRQNCKIL